MRVIARAIIPVAAASGGSTLARDPRVTSRGENEGSDIAFADTIHVRDLDLGATGDELPPVSSPVIVNDPDQGMQWMTPFAFPLPAAARHGLRASIEEARDAWSQAREAATLVERIKALWSFWDWERGDLVRAAIMGAAVFLVVGTVGAFALAAGDDAPLAIGVSASASASEVRAPRTVDQHTGRAFSPSPVFAARAADRALARAARAGHDLSSWWLRMCAASRLCSPRAR